MTNVQTEHINMAERDTVAVACENCGWDNDGKLVLVDRYLTDWPPIPRFNPRAFLEVYRDSGGDPDDRNPTCDGCGLDLEPDSVKEAGVTARVPKVSYTEAALPWSGRVGGGYPTQHEAELAAQFLSFPIMIGKPHPVHGYFLTPHPAPPPKETA